MATPARPRRFYEFGPFRLDPAGRVLLRGGAVLPLPPKAAEILLRLVEEQGNTVSKDELIRAIWPDAFVEESNLTYTISVLRKALGESHGSAAYIETIPKRGYRFIAKVTVREEAEPPLRRLTSRRWKRAAILGGALLLGVLLYGLLSFSRRGEIRSVAVLPFLNLSPDPQDEYFSDGLTEDLTTALSKMPGLKVPARTSAFQFKGKAGDIRSIGRNLDVGAVLEGSVRRQQGRVRVSAQLSRVSDGYHLWSDTYDRDSKDVFAIQDDICRNIVSALNAQLALAARQPRARPYAGDPEVYAIYLRGRYYLNQRTRRSIGQAIRSFSDALDRDASFARAHAGLADSYTLLGMFGMAPSSDAFPRARSAAEKALALDGSLAAAHTSLAAVDAWFDWNPQAAESAFQRAIQLDPGYVLAHQWYAEYLACLGRNPEALYRIDRALELDPLSPNVHGAKAQILYLGRQYDEVIALSRKAAAIGAESTLTPHFLALAREQKGMYREALAYFEKSGSWSDLAHVYAQTGRRAEALALVDKARARAADGEFVPAYSVAEVYAGLGEDRQALAWLERARAERSTWLPYLNVDPRFDRVRAAPRFHALLREAAAGR